jgi:hypothetical protein
MSKLLERKKPNSSTASNIIARGFRSWIWGDELDRAPKSSTATQAPERAEIVARNLT